LPSKFYFRLGEFLRTGKEEELGMVIRKRSTLMAPQTRTIRCTAKIVAWREERRGGSTGRPGGD
jgi:hypothetical protein